MHCVALSQFHKGKDKFHRPKTKMATTVPAIISVGHRQGRVKFTQAAPVSFHPTRDEKRRAVLPRQFTVVATMWNERTHKICAVYKFQGTYSTTFDRWIGEPNHWATDEHWTVVSPSVPESKSGPVSEKTVGLSSDDKSSLDSSPSRSAVGLPSRDQTSLLVSLECKWTGPVSIEDVTCRFSLKFLNFFLPPIKN